MESVSGFITKKLKLKVNEAKSAVGQSHKRKFLSFLFTNEPKPRRRIAPEARERFKKRVREKTRRNRGVSIERMVEELAKFLNGWRAYFGYCETPSILKGFDSWIRRRLRCVIWRQWKRGRRRFAELRKRGVGKDLAACTAGSSHGPWRLSRSPALSIALPISYFDSLGLPKLSPRS